MFYRIRQSQTEGQTNLIIRLSIANKGSWGRQSMFSVPGFGTLVHSKLVRH